MEANAMTLGMVIQAKRPFLKRWSKGYLPGDRTAVRPKREDFPTDRWLIISIPLGGNHFGESRLRNDVLDWELSIFPWLDAHQTAMWDGHELGCGEFRLLLLSPNPSDLLAEIRPKLPPVPGTIRYSQRTGPDGEETPLALS